MQQASSRAHQPLTISLATQIFKSNFKLMLPAYDLYWIAELHCMTLSCEALAGVPSYAANKASVCAMHSFPHCDTQCPTPRTCKPQASTTCVMCRIY
jgi:hypothetical protein